MRILGSRNGDTKNRCNRPARTHFADTITLATFRDVVFPWREGWSADQVVCFQAQRLDPRRTSRLALLQREDIGAALRVTATQRAEIAAAFASAQNESDEAVRALYRRGAAPSQPGAGQRRDTPCVCIDRIQAIRRIYNLQMHETADTVLTAPQLHRLDELDLQYRGPLALIDRKVAARIDLTDPERQSACAGYSEYLAALQGVRQRVRYCHALGTVRKRGSTGGSLLRALAAAYDSEAMRYRTALGAKLLASLPRHYGARWTSELGQCFRFQNPHLSIRDSWTEDSCGVR